MSTVRSKASLAEDLALPIIPETEAILWMSDVLDQALVERKGVAIIGPKGSGKSVALASAIEEFRQKEQERAEAEQRPERRIFELQSPRAERRRDVIGAIWMEVFGMEPLQRARNRTLKKDDVLLQELVELLLQQNAAVLVFDEAECLSDEGIRVVRDIISRAERWGRERRYQEGRYRAFGIGVVLVGTGELLASLKASEELGHRWVRIVEVGLLEPDQVARAYRNFLPGFEAYAKQLGDAAWQEFVRIRVCMGAAMPIRHVENHVRAYVRRMLVDCPNIASVDEISFDEEMFFMTLDEMPRQPDS